MYVLYVVKRTTSYIPVILSNSLGLGGSGSRKSFLTKKRATGYPVLPWEAFLIAHVLKRRLEQPLEGFLGLLGRLSGKMNGAFHLPQLLEHENETRSTTTKNTTTTSATPIEGEQNKKHQANINKSAIECMDAPALSRRHSNWSRAEGLLLAEARCGAMRCGASVRI